MSKAVKILAGLVGLVVLLVVGVFVFVLTLDFDQWKPTIAAQVKAAIGRELTIKGKLSPEIGLSPTIAVEGVSLANASWGDPRPMVSVERFEAKLQLWPLVTSFGKKIIVDRVMLKGADIWLETNDKGVGNWTFDVRPAAGGASPAAATSAGPPPDVEVMDVELQNVKLAYKAAKSVPTVLALEKLTMRGDGGSAPRRIEGSGAYNKLKFDVAGQIGAIAQLLRGPFPVDLTIKAGDRAALRVAGQVRQPMTSRDYEFTASVDMREVGEAAALAAEAGVPGVAVPALGPLKAELKLADKAPGGRPSWTSVKASVGTAELLRLAIDGTVRDPLGPTQTPAAAPGAALKFEGTAPDLAKVAQKLALAAPVTGPLKLSGEVADQGVDKVALKNFSLEAAGSDLAGDAVLAFAGDKPSLTGSFASKAVDLVKLTPPDGAGGGGGSRPAASDGRVIPDAPLPLALLDAANANLRYRAGAIAAPAAKLANVELQAVLNNGALTLKPLTFEMDGGRFAFETTVNAKQRSLAHKGEIRQLEIGRILQERKLNDWFRGGRTSVDLNLRGTGDTVRQVAATLAGDMSVNVGPGEIGQALQRLLGQWLAGVSPALAQLQIGTSVRCAVYSVGFANGVGTLRNGVIETALLAAQTTGTFNLGNETLNMRTIAGPIGVRTGGTFARPDTAVDVGSTLQGVVGGAAGAAAGAAGGVVSGVLGAVTGSGASGTGGCGSGGGTAPAQQRPAVPLPGGGSVPLPNIPNPFRR
ncbi:MAG: AsmA family protein [Alphaproteobacteria bacterium]|nr:AsmA family protein [Alphaproteobacteria bacterium]